MSLPWFPHWLYQHIERHMAAELPTLAKGQTMYEAWEAEFEHYHISPKAAELASIRLVGKAPKPAWHFSMLLKAAKDIEKAWKAKQAAVSLAPVVSAVEAIPQGEELRRCIATARGDGAPARLMRGLFRRLIREGKINPDRIPEDAWEERQEPVVSGLKITR